MYQFWNIFSDKNCYNVFMNIELWQRHPKCSQTSWVDTSSTLKDHYFRLEDLHIIVVNTGIKVTDETTMVFLLFKNIVKIVICLPMKHLELLWTRLNLSVRSRSNWNLEVLVLRRGDNWSTWKKTSWSKGENQQQTQPTGSFDAGIWTRATLVGGSLVYIMLIGKLRHQHAMVPLVAAINTGGRLFICYWIWLSYDLKNYADLGGCCGPLSHSGHFVPRD